MRMTVKQMRETLAAREAALGRSLDEVEVTIDMLGDPASLPHDKHGAIVATHVAFGADDGVGIVSYLGPAERAEVMS